MASPRGSSGALTNGGTIERLRASAALRHMQASPPGYTEFVARAKKRQASIVLTALVVLIVVAVVVTSDAWIYVPACVIILAMVLASPLDDRPDVPNSPFKVWILVVGVIGGAVFLVLGFVSDPSHLLLGALLLAISLPALWMVRHGRNPWWMRGWADYDRR